MGSLALNSLFTVAHFIKARCEHGLKAGELKDKNYIFFEVEILDYKTNKQLCFLDKVRPLFSLLTWKSNRIEKSLTKGLLTCTLAL